MLSEIIDFLTDEDIRNLCWNLGLDHEMLRGRMARDKARSLIGYVQRRGRLLELAAELSKMNPALGDYLIDHFSLEENQGVKSVPRIASEAGHPSRGMFSVQGVNPYLPGLPVMDEEMFFGRHREIDALVSRLWQGKSTAVVGSPDIGVSSFLWRLVNTVSSNEGRFLVAYLDSTDAAEVPPTTLLQQILSQWWQGAGSDITSQRETMPTPELTSLTMFSTLLAEFISAGWRLVLALDHLEQLTWRPRVFDDAFFDMWRELVELGHVFLVTGSHTAPAELFLQSGLNSRLFAELPGYDLGLLDEPAANKLLISPLTGQGLDPEPAIVSEMLSLAGSHPFYLQLAGYCYYEGLIDPVVEDSGVAENFRAAAEPFWLDLWDSLSPIDRVNFLAGGNNLESTTTIRQVNKLANKGVVLMDGEKYRPFSNGFATWADRWQSAENR